MNFLRDQVVVVTTPVLLQGDGVGHDVEGMARALQVAGFRVYVFALTYAPALETWRVDEDTVWQLLQSPDSILIHHHSIGCDRTEALLRSSRSRIRVLRYHNVTPPEFFEGYDDTWVSLCRDGRLTTVAVTSLCDTFLVPSFYNARDLVHAGADVDKIFYLPYFNKLADFDHVAPDASVAEHLSADSRLKVLFLGRRVNNKGHLHLIRTVGEYKRLFDGEIVLHLVGGSDQRLAKYDAELRAEIALQGLQGNVVLHDKSSFAAIVAFYRGCDVFLCMSQHEGFCIPVIEAEYCALPVVAHYRRGVPEALGPTQLWSTSLDYKDFAYKLRGLRESPGTARSLGAAGARSVRKRFDSSKIQQRFLDWIDKTVPVEKPRRTAEDAPRLRVAFVVQRYGEDVSGGAEAIARMFAVQCAGFLDVTVITTNAKTVDWDSDIAISPPLGKEEETGVRVIRFPATYRRNWNDFYSASRDVCANRITIEEWFPKHGPNAPDMDEFLQRNAESFDVIVSWTYMFSTTFYASKLAGRIPLINVPFFHDELWMRLPGMSRTIRAYDAMIFQTDAERALGVSECYLGSKPQIVLGSGIDEAMADQVFAAPTLASRDPPFIVYVGRVEGSKGVSELIDNFMRFKSAYPSRLRLKMIGRAYDIEVPQDADIDHLGFISQEEKFELIKSSVCLVNPSEFESLSLVLLESWAMSRPVLVNGNCMATRSQAAQSGGGLAYRNYREFEWALRCLVADATAASTMGANGRRYYMNNYRWETITPRFVEFIESAAVNCQRAVLSDDVLATQDLETSVE